MVNVLLSLLAAVSFLTCLPALSRARTLQPVISLSRGWFPLVGLLIGLGLVGIDWVAGKVFPEYLTAGLLLVFLIVITRGLHLDGFMDACDGLFGGGTPERRREIMRDTHVGAFAVVGVGGLLILKYGALVSLLSLEAPGREWALLLFPCLSRWTMTLLLAAFPYSRNRGLGRAFHRGDARLPTAIAGVIVVAAAVGLGGIGGAVMLVGVSLLALLLGLGVSYMLEGGLTGDIYGAANELSEVALLVAAVALLPLGLVEPVTNLVR